MLLNGNYCFFRRIVNNEASSQYVHVDLGIIFVDLINHCLQGIFSTRAENIYNMGRAAMTYEKHAVKF